MERPHPTTEPSFYGPPRMRGSAKDASPERQQGPQKLIAQREYRGARRFLTVRKQGADMRQYIQRRVTIDAKTGDVISDEATHGLSNGDLYRPIPGAPRDIKVMFYGLANTPDMRTKYLSPHERSPETPLTPNEDLGRKIRVRFRDPLEDDIEDSALPCTPVNARVAGAGRPGNEITLNPLEENGLGQGGGEGDVLETADGQVMPKDMEERDAETMRVDAEEEDDDKDEEAEKETTPLPLARSRSNRATRIENALKTPVR